MSIKYRMNAVILRVTVAHLKIKPIKHVQMLQLTLMVLFQEQVIVLQVILLLTVLFFMCILTIRLYLRSSSIVLQQESLDFIQQVNVMWVPTKL